MADVLQTGSLPVLPRKSINGGCRAQRSVLAPRTVTYSKVASGDNLPLHPNRTAGVLPAFMSRLEGAPLLPVEKSIGMTAVILNPIE